MKSVLALFLLMTCMYTFSQDCSVSALFKKGSELQYRTYFPKVMSKNYYEVTRLRFFVEDVKDSGNIRYSYITKTGVNPLNEKLNYTKKFVLSCDGNKISIPADFYRPEIVYFSNFYPGEKKDTGYYTIAALKSKSYTNFPINFDKAVFESIGPNIVVEGKTRQFEHDYNNNPTGSTFTGRIIEYSSTMELNIKKSENKGKEKVTTTAGTFDCYKLVETSELEIMKRKRTQAVIFLYTPELGVIKYEVDQDKGRGGYMELESVKNK